MRTLTAFDVDTDALADTFDRIADGLRSNDVLVDQLVAHEAVDVDDPARISAVAEYALIAGTAGPSAVFKAFAALFRRGEVYEVEPGHVRRTSGPKDPDDGAD